MSGAVLSLLGNSGGAASAVTITVNPATITGINIGLTASAQYQLNSSGSAFESVNGGASTLLYAWCVPASQAANYEVYASLVSGSLSGGSSATDTWLALSTTRAWLVSTTSLLYATLNVGIRRVGTATILASADIELAAEAV
jgi:hypothetical protein